jgi:hypothetical protein
VKDNERALQRQDMNELVGQFTGGGGTSIAVANSNRPFPF